MFRIIDPTAQQWDTFVHQHPRAHFLQQSAWGELKAAYGWRVLRVALATEQQQITAGAQILLRPLPGKLGTMAYIPMGPYVTADDQWSALWGAINKRVQQKKAAFLKCEPGIYAHEPAPDLTRWNFQPALQSIQPPSTIMIDLRGSDDTLLARMNQGTRRKIRQSLKNDIQYTEATRADLSKFNALMQTTGQRNAFGVHEPDYYAKMYDLFVPQGDAVLLLAEHEGDALAGIFVFAKAKTAWYLAGASSDVKRNLMASYGIQWQAMQWAKARGIQAYDLWGIPDEEEATLEAQFQERSDDLWGVYGFKRGWGGSVVRSAGAWDRVYNPLLYNGYRAVMWLREQQG